MIETIITAVAAYSLLEPYRLKIEQLDCLSGKIPRSFSDRSILFASDIHCGKQFPLKRVRDLVKKINLLHPDIVVFGGDYISHEISAVPLLFKELKKVRARVAKFGVMGNHDHKFAPAETEKGMRDAGIKMLDNRGYWIRIGSGRIRIGGINDETSGLPRSAENALKGTEKNDFRILVSHNPSFADMIDPGTVDLMLSGHTHGGQIAPLSLFGSFVSNNGFGAKYCRRLLSRNGADILISSGVGTVGLPVRFFAKPEISLITLRTKEGDDI